MEGYKDMTFCPFWEKCKKGLTCPRALTALVKADAEAWWGNDEAPIAQFMDKPECFKEMQDED